ncbi:MAG: Nif3-like dinuclear metal center hexameric protein [Pirellulales bacterium]
MPDVERREFLAQLGATLGGLGLAATAGSSLAADAGGEASPGKRQPTTLEIREYLLANSPWVDRNNTVDTVKCGDPKRPVKKAGVAWFSSIWDIRAAIRAGCDLLVVHEPTFWEHAAPEQNWRNRGPGVAKSKALAESGLVILRAHDTWDNWPEIGIRDSWAKYLGLTKRLREGTSLRWTAVYEIPETSLRGFAQQVANRIGPLGEDSVQVIGDAARKVRRVAVGVGCVVPDQEMVEFGADVLVMCYDGASYWSTRERMAEMGAAVLTVEHGTSEMPGLMSLREHLARQFPAVEFVWIAEHPRTWTVQGRRGRDV